MTHDFEKYDCLSRLKLNRIILNDSIDFEFEESYTFICQWIQCKLMYKENETYLFHNMNLMKYIVPI